MDIRIAKRFMVKPPFSGGASLDCGHYILSSTYCQPQIIVFLLVSIILLILTRPIAIKFFNKERQKTNAESLIGQKAVVLEMIDTIHGTGRVEVNGMEWSAKVDEASYLIDVGEIVVIEGIQGVKLIVRKEEV